MTELITGHERQQGDSGPGKILEQIDESLDIMERHSAELAAAEEGIQEEMRKRDREYKDARLHSIPNPRKHQR
jgi:hypothetical protein